MPLPALIWRWKKNRKHTSRQIDLRAAQPILRRSEGLSIRLPRLHVFKICRVHPSSIIDKNYFRMCAPRCPVRPQDFVKRPFLVETGNYGSATLGSCERGGAVSLMANAKSKTGSGATSARVRQTRRTNQIWLPIRLFERPRKPHIHCRGASMLALCRIIHTSQEGHLLFSVPLRPLC